ncbi:hypothetical protein [Psychroserpens damuponensis]|uniref:hypothetical protein n=1 Tax=Psychroserpens damuponensis TaxID=943936 RepID=UPI000B1E63FE|nr:hypothetical protein [Psychroserpens damuponensis]
MIITKLLGLTSTLTKSKKAKIAILLLEVGILAYALKTNNDEKSKNKQLEK